MNEDKKKGKDFIASRTAEGVIIIAFAGACYLLGCLTSWSFDFKEWNTFSFINSSFLFLWSTLILYKDKHPWIDKSLTASLFSYPCSMVLYLLGSLACWSFDMAEWNLFVQVNWLILSVLAWLFGMMQAFDWPDKHILVFCLSYVLGLVCYLIVCFFNKDLDATKWSLSDICTSGIVFAFIIEKFYWEFRR